MAEQWKSIKGFTRYEVSTKGNVRVLDYRYTGGARNIRTNAWGNRYAIVHLYENGKKYIRTVHRLVAEAFIPNPDGKPCVNHRNGDKKDNRLENLEWTTIGENTKHAYATGLFVNPKRKAVKCLETGVVYTDSYAAAKDTGATQGSISQCCLGKYKQTVGLHFTYAGLYDSTS